MSIGIRSNDVRIIERDNLVDIVSGGLTFIASQMVAFRPYDDELFFGTFKVEADDKEYQARILDVTAYSFPCLTIVGCYQPDDDGQEVEFTIEVMLGMSESDVAAYESNE